MSRLLHLLTARCFGSWLTIDELDDIKCGPGCGTACSRAGLLDSEDGFTGVHKFHAEQGKPTRAAAASPLPCTSLCSSPSQTIKPSPAHPQPCIAAAWTSCPSLPASSSLPPLRRRWRRRLSWSPRSGSWMLTLVRAAVGWGGRDNGPRTCLRAEQCMLPSSACLSAARPWRHAVSPCTTPPLGKGSGPGQRCATGSPAVRHSPR